MSQQKKKNPNVRQIKIYKKSKVKIRASILFVRSVIKSKDNAKFKSYRYILRQASPLESKLIFNNVEMLDWTKEW